jgi:hypothetical protein
MPPWLPEPGYGDFADVRRLTDQDQALLKRWITGGMAQGDMKAAPPQPITTPPGRWASPTWS